MEIKYTAQGLLIYIAFGLYILAFLAALIRLRKPSQAIFFFWLYSRCSHLRLQMVQCKPYPASKSVRGFPVSGNDCLSSVDIFIKIFANKAVKF